MAGVKHTPVAESVPYDPNKDPDCDITSENVQDAIDELCQKEDDLESRMIILECIDFPCVVKACELIDHNLCFLQKPEDC